MWLRRLTVTLGTLSALAAGFGLLARLVSPHDFWPPAIVALALPLLLLGTAVFAIYFVIRRHLRAAALPIVVLLMAWPVYGKLFSLPDPQPEGNAAPRVAITTANLRLFRTQGGIEVDTSRVRDAVHSMRADILLLQEARPDHRKAKFFESIKEGGSYSQRHQFHRTFVATYADELEEVSAHFAKPNEYNGFLVSDVKTEVGTLRVINAHLESNQISDMTGGIGSDNSLTKNFATFGRMLQGYGRAARRRARQAAAIREVVQNSPYPVILGGDFNDVPSSYTYDHVMNTGRLRDAWAERGTGLGTTFTGPLPGLRIDYLLVDTSLTVMEVERLEPEWSDHRPLRAEIRR